MDEKEIKKILFLEKRGSFGSKPDKWRPDAIRNDPTLWINVDQRGSKGRHIQHHATKTGHDNSCPRKYGSFGSMLIRH